MSRSNDVGGYRGRRTITDILKIIAEIGRASCRERV